MLIVSCTFHSLSYRMKTFIKLIDIVSVSNVSAIYGKLLKGRTPMIYLVLGGTKSLYNGTAAMNILLQKDGISHMG